MFISKKRLERILQKERQETENKVWQECARQREGERLDKRISDLERKVWELDGELHGANKLKVARTKKV
jgi:hypothetical protein